MASRINVAAFALKDGGAKGGLIAGNWTSGATGKLLDVVNPASGEVIAKVPDMNSDDTHAAIDAAAAAFPAWSAKAPVERAAILRKMYDLMHQNMDGLAALLTAECGKPFEEAKGEITYAASFFEWFAEEAKRGYGQVIPPPRADRRMLATKQPVGVAALLTPWNFSSAMVTRKIAPALAAGCTTVVRPSANTPLSAIAVAQLAEQAGVPKGVINLIISNDHEATAGVLCAHPTVKKVSFTGSTRVGKILMAQSASTLKKLSLELGGNAPFIVFEDADIDAAVEGCIASKFRNAGQTCVCANRIFVHEKVYDVFKSKLQAKVAELTVGDGMTAGVKIGPLISEAALKKTESLVADAIAKGAKAVAGGKRPSPASIGGLKGWFYEPTILEGIKPGMDIAREEIFGPVAPLHSFKDDAEVLAKANDAEVGLAGYIFTKCVLIIQS
jgi:succinate-semialdehyde dehydrogenase / glutarate-semialdehyde dehydrogenase